MKSPSLFFCGVLLPIFIASYADGASLEDLSEYRTTTAGRSGGVWEDMSFAHVPAERERLYRAEGGGFHLQRVSATGLRHEIVEMDFNRDGLPDIVRYEADAPKGPRHLVFPGTGPGVFADSPGMMFSAPGGGLGMGRYADMNGDGFLDHIQVETSEFGLLNTKALSTLSVYPFDPEKGEFPSEPAFRVKRKGWFFDRLNGLDLDGDGRTDLVLCDVSHGAVTTEQLASALFDGKISLRLYVYLSSDSRIGFAETPSFQQVMKVGIAKTPLLRIVRMGRYCTPVLCSDEGEAKEYFAYDIATRKFVQIPRPPL